MLACLLMAQGRFKGVDAIPMLYEVDGLDRRTKTTAFFASDYFSPFAHRPANSDRNTDWAGAFGHQRMLNTHLAGRAILQQLLIGPIPP